MTNATALRQLADKILEQGQFGGFAPGPAASVCIDAAEEIERLCTALDPFADVARWAARNSHDLTKGWDMLLRGPDGIAGHLQVQSPDFVKALEALDHEQGERK